MKTVTDEEIRLTKEVERLKGLLNRDRTGLAAGLDAVRKIATSYDWICEGRGTYAYDDDRYRMEVGALITQVVAAVTEALRASGAVVDEAFHPRARETALMLEQATTTTPQD